MTRDEIIRIAQEMGFDEQFIGGLSRRREKGTAFYVGRSACSEEVFMLFSLAFAAGAKVEREECAKVCEPKTSRPCDCERCECGNATDARMVAEWDEAARIATAIRARGQK